MTIQTIAATLTGAATALCAEYAGPLLSAAAPDQIDAADSAFVIERGERFAVVRGVAIVPVTGMLTPNAFVYERYLGWSTYHGIADTLDMLAASDEVAAVAMVYDTPGGLVIGTEAASEAVARFASVKPVHALVNPMALSAAYWVASQSTDITMTPGSQVGSIGTQFRGSAAMETGMHGHREFTFRSSNARAKNPDPSTEVGAALILAQLDEMETAFHAAVSAGRGIAPADLVARISATDDPIDGGRTFGFADAQARGLADHSATHGDFFNDLFERYGPKPRPAGARAFGARAAAAVAVSQT